MKITRQTMLRAMLAADSAYDGRFITGVITTGIYCLPSCRARKPRPENVQFYSSPTSAQADGLRACLRCRPDDFYAGLYAEETLLDDLLQLPLSECSNVATLADRAQVSVRRLRDIFWRQRQQTPADWLAAKRIKQAQHQLLYTTLPIITIAYDVGFSSLSVFGTQFRRRTGLSPTAFRRLTQGLGFRLALPHWFCHASFFQYLNRQNVTQKVRDHRASFALPLPSGHRVMRVDFSGAHAKVMATGPLLPSDALALWQMIWRMLGGMAVSQGKAGALAALGSQASKSRIYLFSTIWDALLWAVLGQQVSVQVASTFYARLVRKIDLALPDGLYAPPLPANILQLTNDDWREIGLTQRRAQTLCALAQQENWPILSDGPIPRLVRQLQAVHGIGLWSVAYVLMRGLGLPDVVPSADSALAGALMHHFQLSARPTPAEVDILMKPYAPLRSLATLHF